MFTKQPSAYDGKHLPSSGFSSAPPNSEPLNPKTQNL